MTRKLICSLVAFLSVSSSTTEAQCEFAELQASVPFEDGEYGVSCALGADRLVVGSITRNTANEEAVYIYRLIGQNWFLEQRLVNPTGLNDNFGSFVDIDDEGDTIVVSSLGDNSAGVDAGAAYVFDMGWQHLGSGCEADWLLGLGWRPLWL